MPTLDIDWLRSFVAVAESGGFTQAAKRVHRTQSAVSMQIRKLEDAVGRPLFERDGRGAALTPTGAALLVNARQLLALHDETVARLARPETINSVRLGTPHDYVARFLPEVLRRFAEAHPQVPVEVVCDTSAHMRELLAGDELDLALATRVPGWETGTILRREALAWICSPGHALHAQRPLPLALFNAGFVMRDWTIAALEAHDIPYRIVCSSRSVDGVLAAVTAGLAVGALMPSTVPAHLRILDAGGGLPPLPSAAISLLRNPGRHSPVLEHLAEAITAALCDGSA